MSTWIKGFFCGFIMVVIATVVALIVVITIEVMRGDGVMIPLFPAILIIWSVEIVLLTTLGKIPHKITTQAFFSRLTFYWVPVIIGWYIAVNFYAFAFWVGLFVSSTFVGYQVTVTKIKIQKSWAAFKGIESP